jgi:hypothetical protein
LGNNNGFNNKHLISKYENISLSKQNQDFDEYMTNELNVHSSDSIPSLYYYDWINSDFRANCLDVEFSEYIFKKLEYPYDTNTKI